MTVPIVFDKPTNVWLGFLVIALLQVTSGILMVRGRRVLFAPHVMNAGPIAVVVGVRAFSGIGVWFLSFRYGYRDRAERSLSSCVHEEPV